VLREDGLRQQHNGKDRSAEQGAEQAWQGSCELHGLLLGMLCRSGRSRELFAFFARPAGITLPHFVFILLSGAPASGAGRGARAISEPRRAIFELFRPNSML